MNITTNNIPRPLLPLTDLPKGAAGDFDYIEDPHEYRMVCYRGVWYDVWDSMRCPGAEAPEASRSAFAGWDGYISDSYFSGVLFRFMDDDHVVCATYTC